jgi:PAS domain S-box-containing protein
MDDKMLISKEEYSDLNNRLKKLAIEKSYLQVFMHLMSELNSVSGLENTIQKLLQIILENIGGSNLIVYYIIDNEIYYADVIGKKMNIEQIEDEIVKKVFETKEYTEIQSDFADTKLLSTEFTKASTWAFPLMVGTDLIAVLKIECLYTSTSDLHFHLPTFFSYAAHILKNEILGHTKLMAAFNQLKLENDLRKHAEEELKIINTELENRVADRTTELQKVNQQLFTLIENLPDFVTRYDKDCRYLYVSPVVANIFGIPLEQIIGKSIRELPLIESQEQNEVLQTRINQVFEQGILNTYEAKWTTDQGERFFEVRHIPELDQYGRVVSVLGITRDITESKQTAEMATQLAAIVKSSDETVISKTLEGIITSWNKGAERIYGYTESEIIGKSISILMPPEHTDRLPMILEKIRRGEHIENYETVRLRKDGQLIHVSLTISPVLDSDGSIIGASTIGHDITERKRTEEALRESETKLRTIFECSRDAIGVSKNGVHVFANPAYLKLFGYESLEKLVGTSILDNIAPSHRQQILQNIKHRSSGEQTPLFYETRGKRTDGQEFDFEINVSMYELNGEKYTVANIRNITERKLTEQALYKSEQEFRTLTENSPDVIVRYNRAGQRIYVNPEFERINHLSANEVFGKTPVELSTELAPMANVFTEKLMAAMASGKINKIDLSWTKNGKPICWFIRIVPEFDANGIVISALTIWSDISERKQAEEEIHKLNLELEQRVIDRTIQLQTANKELEAFAYSVSHDLRAPLRSIDGFSQVLLDDYQELLEEQGINYLHRVRSAAQRMAHLIDDMLNLSRVSRGEISIQEVDLSEIVHTIANDLLESQPERNVEFIIQDGVKVHGDDRLLHIVMENLLGNAWKFTSKHPTARIEFGLLQKEKSVYFVRDDGAGFDMSYSVKLFNAFQRLHTISEFPGTGVGLATVQRIIYRHGGEVWAEGEVENLPVGKPGGATFYFTIS